MFSYASGVTIHGGTFINTSVNQPNCTSKGMDLLIGRIAAGAFHNSDELNDAPKCDPQTCFAVLDDIMQWVDESELSREDFMLWLYGPAGAGKTSIAKKIAELAEDKNLLIGTFFFSRTSPTRSTKDRLVATLAYQLALSIPDTRAYIEDAIERDPVIFKKNIQIQIDTLLIKPFQAVATHIIPFPRLIIIDGLDECNDSQAQVAILDAISRSFRKRNLSIIFLVVSRPKLRLVTSFNRNEPLRSIHRRLLLDNTYLSENSDIRDKLRYIILRTTLVSWPTEQLLIFFF